MLSYLVALVSHHMKYIHFCAECVMGCILQFLGFGDQKIWVNAIAITCLGAGFYVMGYFVLVMRYPKFQKFVSLV